jgi:hypothetical protein
METATNVLKCHDCQKEIKIEDPAEGGSASGGKNIKNGLRLIYNNNGKNLEVFKCKACYEKNPALTNFQKCEVYSRIVGYIRPIEQWHKGKQQEFIERKEFKCC